MIRHFTAALCFIAAAASAPAALGDRPGELRLGVRLDDLNLQTEAGVDRLATRFVRRFWSICGTPHQTTMTYVMTGGGLKERAACKATLRVGPSASPEIQRAFTLALERMR